MITLVGIALFLKRKKVISINGKHMNGLRHIIEEAVPLFIW